jgi:hypothetical protein
MRDFCAPSLGSWESIDVLCVPLLWVLRTALVVALVRHGDSDGRFDCCGDRMRDSRFRARTCEKYVCQSLVRR